MNRDTNDENGKNIIFGSRNNRILSLFTCETNYIHATKSEDDKCRVFGLEIGAIKK